MGATGNELCPVAALLAYLALRGSRYRPVFVNQTGLPLIKGSFVENLRAALKGVGINGRDYAGHSFRIGAATTAAEKGVEDSLIKTLGRWESNAYQTYIRVPREVLAETSLRLAR